MYTKLNPFWLVKLNQTMCQTYSVSVQWNCSRNWSDSTWEYFFTWLSAGYWPQVLCADKGLVVEYYSNKHLVFVLVRLSETQTQTWNKVELTYWKDDYVSMKNNKHTNMVKDLKLWDIIKHTKVKVLSAKCILNMESKTTNCALKCSPSAFYY